MALKKKHKKQAGPQSKSARIKLNPTKLGPEAGSGPLLTNKYLITIWRTHPIRPKSVLRLFTIVSAIAFFLAVVAEKGFGTAFILQLASENMMPRTAIVLGAVCLWVLSGVIAYRGPFTARSGWIYRTFGVALPATALLAWGSLCGITIGAFGAALVLGAPVATYVGEVVARLALFAFGLLVFLSITVTTGDASVNATQRFKLHTRRIAAVMLLVMTGWFIIGGLYIANP